MWNDVIVQIPSLINGLHINIFSGEQPHFPVIEFNLI